MKGIYPFLLSIQLLSSRTVATVVKAIWNQKHACFICNVRNFHNSSHDFWWLWLDSSQVEKDGDSARLESRFSRNDSTRVTINDSRHVSFMQNLRDSDRQTQFFLHTKKWSFLGPVMIKIGAKFLFWLSSRVILYPKGQVLTACTETDLRFAFHWVAWRAQCRRYANTWLHTKPPYTNVKPPLVNTFWWRF